MVELTGSLTNHLSILCVLDIYSYVVIKANAMIKQQPLFLADYLKRCRRNLCEEFSTEKVSFLGKYCKGFSHKIYYRNQRK